MSLACHCYCKTYLSALPTRANHDCLQAILRLPTRTFLRRRYATWRRDVAAPSLAMMFFRAMSYCANLRKWKLPVLAYLRGHQLVLPRECVLRESDSGGLWCIGAPRFTDWPGQILGLLLVLLQLLILAQGLRMSLACHCYCKTYLSALPPKTNHDCLQAILRFPTRTFLRRRYVTWRRDLAAPLLAMMFFRAMSYCANLRKWKLPVLAYLHGY